jgi:D-isomer specific 2-hydroxyacid dehydrogenase, NAD binding domain
VLIVGVGGAGGEASKLRAALGMRVLGIDPRVTERPPGMADLATPYRMVERLGEADFVILTTPETPDTVGMFNTRLFSRMKHPPAPGTTGHLLDIGEDAHHVKRRQRITQTALDEDSTGWTCGRICAAFSSAFVIIWRHARRGAKVNRRRPKPSPDRRGHQTADGIWIALRLCAWGRGNRHASRVAGTEPSAAELGSVSRTAVRVGGPRPAAWDLMSPPATYWPEKSPRARSGCAISH